jgi:hypothetical protein
MKYKRSIQTIRISDQITFSAIGSIWMLLVSSKACAGSVDALPGVASRCRDLPVGLVRSPCRAQRLRGSNDSLAWHRRRTDGFTFANCFDWERQRTPLGRTGTRGR